jgi:hypothetical protein
LDLWEKNDDIERRKAAALIQTHTGFNVNKPITSSQFNAVIGRGDAIDDPIVVE